MEELTQEQLLGIASLFNLDSAPVSVKQHGEGHINRTFCVTTQSGRRYILQRINHQVFKDVDGLMENIVNVTKYLAQRDQDPRHVQHVVPTKDGKNYVQIDGNYWRILDYITGSKCLQLPETDRDFYYSAVAFGHFQQELKDYPAASLHETIPNFHNTVSRYRDFKETLAKDPEHRAQNCRPEIDFVLAREEDGAHLVHELEAGRLPLKVTHNDTKLNNVMLDQETGEPLCVIDLDTIMPGLAAYDFGDAIRFGASTALEDEADLSKVNFDMDRFKAFTKGYLEACPDLTPAERDSLVWGSKIMTLECGARFLADYIDGDHYFGVSKPDHNLLRARTQFKLVSEMEHVWDEMFAVVHSFQ